VESGFDKDRTPAEIRQFFPGAVNISVSPMRLREIFVTLAAATRKAA
jgi:hypothetical protein